MFPIIMILSLYFLILSTSQRIKVVNFGAMPTETIQIRISENFDGFQSIESNQQPQEVTAQELQELTTVFAMFSLLDELSNQIFNSANDNQKKGFLDLNDILSGGVNHPPNNKNKDRKSKHKSNVIVEEEPEADEQTFNNINDDFNEAHVEFIEGNSADSINDKNQEKLKENIKIREKIENDISNENNTETSLKEEDSVVVADNETTIINTRKKDPINEKGNISNNKKAFALVAALIIALLLYCFLKQKMSKLEKIEYIKEEEEKAAGLNKIHQKQQVPVENKGN